MRSRVGAEPGPWWGSGQSSRCAGETRGRPDSSDDGDTAVEPRATVRARTWYFRLLLKGTIAGVIVGVRSLSEIRSPQEQALGLRAMGTSSEGGGFGPSHSTQGWAHLDEQSGFVHAGSRHAGRP